MYTYVRSYYAVDRRFVTDLTSLINCPSHKTLNINNKYYGISNFDLFLVMFCAVGSSRFVQREINSS